METKDLKLKLMNLEEEKNNIINKFQLNVPIIFQSLEINSYTMKCLLIKTNTVFIVNDQGIIVDDELSYDILMECQMSIYKYYLKLMNLYCEYYDEKISIIFRFNLFSYSIFRLKFFHHIFNLSKRQNIYPKFMPDTRS